MKTRTPSWPLMKIFDAEQGINLEWPYCTDIDIYCQCLHMRGMTKSLSWSWRPILSYCHNSWWYDASMCLKYQGRIGSPYTDSQSIMRVWQTVWVFLELMMSQVSACSRDVIMRECHLWHRYQNTTVFRLTSGWWLLFQDNDEFRALIGSRLDMFIQSHSRRLPFSYTVIWICISPAWLK